MTTTTNPRTRALRAAAASRARYAVQFWARETDDTRLMVRECATDEAIAYLRHCKANLRAAQTTLSALSY